MAGKTTAPATVEEYLASLPEDRRAALETMRRTILANLDPEIREGIQYGGIGYFVPHEVYPAGYHCDPKQPLPMAGLASTKGHMALHLFCLYTDPAVQEAFRKAWIAAGKKLDMGKSCVRFRKIEDVPLEVVADLFRKVTAKGFIATYEAAFAGRLKPKARKPAGKKAISRKRS